MHIIVCIKQVPDPEGDREAFEITENNLSVQPRGIPPVLGVFDENALEAALCIRDGAADPVKITVLSAGNRVPDAVMNKALAAGADEVVKVEDPLLASENFGTMQTAVVLARVIREIGTGDLILTGRQSSDLNTGQTGIALGQHLDIPVISIAQKVDASNGQVRAQRLIPGGYEVVEADLPALVVVSNEVGELRYPAMKARREARKKPIRGMTLGETGPAEGGWSERSFLVLKRLTYPAMPNKKCLYLPSSDPVTAGQALVDILVDHHFV